MDRREWLGGVLASACMPGASASAAGREGPAPLPVRECYCPGHFGNSYEAMWPRETAAYLAELKALGFNRLGEWIETVDVHDPFQTATGWDLGKEQLDRKKRTFLAAQGLGLERNLIVTPNHVYLDQVRPEWEAKKTPKIFGQLLCPSRPEARAVVLRNFERWFGDLADAGVRLNAFTAFAYDFGGCDCDRCRPWILTFARLMKEVHGIALRRHPGIEPWCCSWWWTPEEHALFNDWAAREAPGWLRAMTMHIEYDQTRPKDLAVPAGCRKLAFVHIGYGNRRDSEIYGHEGAVVAPGRLTKTLEDLRAGGFEGFQAYSEGCFDDANKAIVAGLASGRVPDADAALADYARRYLGATDATAPRWAAWLARWGDRRSVRLPSAADELAALTRDAPTNWRLDQWRIKVELETLDRAIGKPSLDDWTPARRDLADRWFATQERLYRDVYRLGPVRHVINPRTSVPAWHASWSKAVGSKDRTGVLSPRQ